MHVFCGGRQGSVKQPQHVAWSRIGAFPLSSSKCSKHCCACEAWETLEQARRLDGGGPCNLPLVMRPRRLDTVYLHSKARFLEHFLEQFVFELSSKDALVTFLDPSLPYTVEI